MKSPEQVRAEHLMGVACGVIMLLATIVFLVWGFVPLFDQIGGGGGVDKFVLKEAVRTGQGGFAVSWIAFVVGGILCGIVYLVGSVASKSKEDWVAEARQEDAWIKYAQSDAATNDPVETRLRGIQTLAEPRAHPKPRKALLEVAGLFSLLWTLHNKENNRILITAMR